LTEFVCHSLQTEDAMANNVEPSIESQSTALIRVRSYLEILVLVLIAAVLATVLVQIGRGRWLAAPAVRAASATAPAARPELALPAEPLPLDGAELQGSPTADIVLIEYSDFQCPYCGRFARETLPELERAFVKTGKLQFAFHEFPLDSIHKFALPAAEAMACAGEQGQFWKMHDLTFADQAHLDAAAIEVRAVAAGLDHARFDACLRGPVAERVRADAKTGEALGVTGTPTFFVGRRQADGRVKVFKRLSGALPVAEFRAAIDAVAAPAAKTK
jgi:protein-disulfide isomerase